MKKLVFLLAVFSIVFFSCEKNKEKTTIIEGVVLNAGTKQPIDSVKVLLKDGNANTSGSFGIDGNTSSGKSATVYTDKEGKFTIQITGEFTPFLLASKKDYSFWGINPHRNLFGDYIPMKFGLNQKTEIQLFAKSYFKPVLMQKDLSIVYDKIVYSFMSKDRVTGELVTHSRVYFVDYGSHTVSDPAFGEMINYYQIEKYSSFGVETIIDSVYIPGFTTYIDTIYY